MRALIQAAAVRLDQGVPVSSAKAHLDGVLHEVRSNLGKCGPLIPPWQWSDEEVGALANQRDVEGAFRWEGWTGE